MALTECSDRSRVAMNANDIITTIFSKERTVKYVTENIHHLLGKVPSEVIGEPDLGLIEKVGVPFKRIHRSGYVVTMELLCEKMLPGGDLMREELVIHNPSGSVLGGHESAGGVDASDGKQQLSPIDVAKLNASALSREVLLDFVQRGSVGIHLVTADGIVAWANEADMRICGYDASDYIGSSIVPYHADAEVISDILTKLTNRQTLKEYRARLRHKDGSIRHVVIDSSVNFDSDGNFVNTRCFTRDVTELREAELAREAVLEMKSLFLSRISHDIRTPLNGIIGMSSLLNTSGLTQEQREYAEVIKTSSDYLLNIVESILSHSKMEAGMIQLVPAPLSILSVRAKICLLLLLMLPYVLYVALPVRSLSLSLSLSLRMSLLWVSWSSLWTSAGAWLQWSATTSTLP